MYRKTWQLRGSYSNYILVRRHDLSADVKAVRFNGALVPNVFDPCDPFSIHNALRLCQATWGDLYHLPWSAHQLRAYIEIHLKGALERGEIVMIPADTRAEDVYIVGPKKRGKGKAWRVEATSGRLWVVRREHILAWDEEVRVEIGRIIDGLTRATSSENIGEIRELLNIPVGDQTQVRAMPNINELRSRLEFAFRSREIVVVREIASYTGADSSDGSSAAVSPARPPSPPREEINSKIAWIEVQVLDMEEKPVPGVRYEIRLPDGTLAAGVTNDGGLARYDWILPGECEISFPDLDRNAWRPL